jgi:biopolymer transport protein ExbD
MKFKDESKQKQRPNIDLTPMIDVVFQLLIFFMLSATFVVQSSIQIEMPEAKGATNLEQKDLAITLAYGTDGPDGKGKIYVDSQDILSMEELTRVLSEKAKDNPDIQVAIRSDARSDTGRLMEVMGIASSVGMTKFQMVAQPDADDQ